MQKFKGINYKRSKKIPLTKEEHEELGELIKEISWKLLEWEERLCHGYPEKHPLRKYFSRAFYDIINETCHRADDEYFKQGFNDNGTQSPYYGKGAIKPGWRP